ncbi:hypothetical protein [Streptomyces sp. CRN 30]|uniref:hypothetical protein n=1 Tax=Streptomyces sp. CRN 30 TaxID=3075613 RepID=UPI002A7F1B52|nr:hypothetical protein [Streptomyces sp. CRN 30]
MTTDTPVPDEDHPTGTAWRSGPRPAGLPEYIRPWTPEEQLRHVADLLDGIDGYAVGQPMQAAVREPDGPPGGRP